MVSSLTLEGVAWVQSVQKKGAGHVAYMAFQGSTNPLRFYIADAAVADKLAALVSPSFYRFRIAAIVGRFGLIMDDFEVHELD